MEEKKEQFINLSDDCYSGIAVHKIGHTVGLAHEHNRTDRNSFILILPENIQSGQEQNFTQSSARYFSNYCLIIYLNLLTHEELTSDRLEIESCLLHSGMRQQFHPSGNFIPINVISSCGPVFSRKSFSLFRTASSAVSISGD